MLRSHKVPSSIFSEAADGVGRDESPCDFFDLNKLLHGQIRSGHHCSERRAIAALSSSLVAVSPLGFQESCARELSTA